MWTSIRLPFFVHADGRLETHSESPQLGNGGGAILFDLNAWRSPGAQLLLRNLLPSPNYPTLLDNLLLSHSTLPNSPAYCQNLPRFLSPTVESTKIVPTHRRICQDRPRSQSNLPRFFSLVESTKTSFSLAIESTKFASTRLFAPPPNHQRLTLQSTMARIRRAAAAASTHAPAVPPRTPLRISIKRPWQYCRCEVVALRSLISRQRRISTDADSLFAIVANLPSTSRFAVIAAPCRASREEWRLHLEETSTGAYSRFLRKLYRAYKKVLRCTLCRQMVQDEIAAGRWPVPRFTAPGQA